jgi:hypothetical protein
MSRVATTQPVVSLKITLSSKGLHPCTKASVTEKSALEQATLGSLKAQRWLQGHAHPATVAGSGDCGPSTARNRGSPPPHTPFEAPLAACHPESMDRTAAQHPRDPNVGAEVESGADSVGNGPRRRSRAAREPHRPGRTQECGRRGRL